MWVALLNLENMYGTEESLKKVFERALQFCEPMPVYQQLADIYSKSDKTKVRPTDGFLFIYTSCVLKPLLFPFVTNACSVVCLHQEAESLYKSMVKRFRQNKTVWLSYGTFLLQQGESEAASALLQRALKSLPSKESKMACVYFEDVIECAYRKTVVESAEIESLVKDTFSY